MGVSGGFAAMGIMSAGSAYSQGISQKAQSDYTASMYGINSQLAGEQGKLTKAEGDVQGGQMAEEGKMQVAKQRVDEAATGANVNSGSALELQTDTNWQSSQNQITIKNNAWRQAWGYGVQASDYTNQGNLSSLSGQNQLNNSYLTGGMNAVGFGVQAGSSYYKYNGGYSDDGNPSGFGEDGM